MEGPRRQTSQTEGGQQPSKRPRVEEEHVPRVEEEEHACAVCEIFLLRRHYTEHFGLRLLEAAWGQAQLNKTWHRR
jgi:hypothetical protein